MMRSWLLALLAICAAPCASAQERSVAEQFRDAYQVFMGNAEDNLAFAVKYRERILAGLPGRWVQLLPGIEERTEPCEKMPIEITTESPYSFVLRRLNKDPDRVVDTSYVSIGGNQFGEQVDPEQYLRRLGLKELPESSAAAGPLASALSSINGIAAIFRPSPDILVIQTNFRPPAFYGRCP